VSLPRPEQYLERLTSTGRCSTQKPKANARAFQTDGNKTEQQIGNIPRKELRPTFDHFRTSLHAEILVHCQM